MKSHSNSRRVPTILQWYNPRKGGDMQKGAVESIRARSQGGYSLGMPPEADGKDWVALLTKK